MKNANCPICGYAEMPYPPVPENICPCCGTQYGFDDYYHTPRELRLNWIRAGFPWFDDITRPPKNWNPVLQLIKADLAEDLLQPTWEMTATEQKDNMTPIREFWYPTETEMFTIDLRGA